MTTESIIKVTGFIASLEFCLQENGYYGIFPDNPEKMRIPNGIEGENEFMHVELFSALIVCEPIPV